MHWQVLATDYDGTLAHDGRVEPATWHALERLRAAGMQLVLITGRVLPELLEVCDRLELFDAAVIENGAVLYEPSRRQRTVLAAPPSPQFLDALQVRGVAPVITGEVIVATFQPHQHAVQQAIDATGLPLQVIMNKDAVMVLPHGVDKAYGLQLLARQAGWDPYRTIGIGDAENDLTFLEWCGYSVAVANALPEVQAAVDWTAPSPRGAGVIETVERLLNGTLPPARRNRN